MSNRGMSLESMLDQERRDVLALLEGAGPVRKKSANSIPTLGRAASPLNLPQSPVRSMLDIDDDFVAWHSNLTSNTAVPTSPRAVPVRSMLDFGGIPPSSPAVRSMLDVSVTPSSTVPPPAEHIQKAKVVRGVHPRSHSDTAARPASFGPRSVKTGVDVETAYQFTGFLPSNPGGPFQPKRNTQGGKRGPFPSAMSEVVRGGDLSGFPRDRGRNSLPGGSLGTGSFSSAKSRSPHNRLGLRSDSPLMGPDYSSFTLDNGREIYSNSAYKMLSDEKLATSGGNLSLLGKKGGRRRTNSDTTSLPGGGRLEKDTPTDGEEASDDSSDERQQSSDEERPPRGRKPNVVDLKTGMYPNGEGYLPNAGPQKKTSLSLLAAAEEERQEIATAQQNAIVNAKAKYKIRSLLDPSITVTGPGGERSHRTSKPGVHPNTSFDEGASGLNTPVDSDTEQDLTDIKRAQKLSINMTSVVSTPATSRSVRTIYRGDFAKMQQEALDNQRRVRKYLVATDLSEEAAHALEWTIGTVLRDGDTLLAIYCVDEETGIVANEGSADDSYINEQVAAIAAAATRPSGSTPIMNATNAPSPLGPRALRLDSVGSNASPMGREKGKQEQERFRAIQDITDRVARLLRKTKLQVKVVIEVIHCKSPKHLITEVIDYISPTLVILGSRGRSALKGVILGSFSNYLVTKSSVPVMVARKRLRKHTKYKRPPVRLANNLANPAIKKTLAAAKIDELG